MTEQDKKGLAKALNDYIELKRSQAECTGFIDGFEKAIEYMNQGQLLPEHDVSELSISEHDKITMAGEWSRSRSEGDREQDRQCNYDYVMGIEAAIRKLNAR